MSRPALWRSIGGFLIACILVFPATWLYSRIQMARDIAYWRQFPGPFEFRTKQVTVPRPAHSNVISEWTLTSDVPTSVSLSMKAEQDATLVEQWTPALLKPRVGPLCEQPEGLIVQYNPRSKPEPEFSRAAGLLGLKSLLLLTDKEPTGLVADGGPSVFVDLKFLSSMKGLESLLMDRVRVEESTARSIAKLTSLQNLELSDHRMTDSDIAPLFALKSLRRLRLDSPLLTDTGLARLGELTQMASLDLSRTQVTRECLRHLAGMPQLASLNLPQSVEFDDDFLARIKHTRLYQLEKLSPSVTDRGLKHISEMTHLKMLDLRGTQVTGTGLRQLQSVKTLESLMLPESEGIGDGLQSLTTLPLKSLDIPRAVMRDADLPDLVSLLSFWTRNGDVSFADSQITDAGLPVFATAKTIVQLNLSNTGVSDAGLDSLLRLPALRRLDLSHTRVTSGGLKTLAQFRGLQELELAETQVDDTDLAELAKLPGLRRLNLRGTRVTNAGMVSLCGCHTLESLNVMDTAVSDEGYLTLAAIQTLAHPEIEPNRVSLEAWNEFERRKAAQRSTVIPTGP